MASKGGKLTLFFAEILKNQVQSKLGEEAQAMLTDAVAAYIGDETTEKIANFLEKEKHVPKIIEAFEKADRCFEQKCEDDLLRQFIVSMPLARLENLEKLALNFLDDLDRQELSAALHNYFSSEWGKKISEAQIEQAAKIYHTCLEQGLASDEGYILKVIFAQISAVHEKIDDLQRGIENITSEITTQQFPVEFVDEKIEDELKKLRKARFFTEFDRKRFSLDFSEKLLTGLFSSGTSALKSQALAWCSRILSVTDELPKAEEYLAKARKLGSNPEGEVAQAFIYSQKGEKGEALRVLNKITSPLSLSASLMIVDRHDGTEDAITWLKTAQIDIMDLDADGKFFLLSKLIQVERLDLAKGYLEAITDRDLLEAPVLHQAIAMVHLLQTVTPEFHIPVLLQVPLDAAHFPLAADLNALDERREAHKHFLALAEKTRQLNYLQTASLYEEYALWLELRDHDTASDGRKKLESKLRGNEVDLSFVSLGLQFDIPLNIEKIETEIRRQVALNGGDTYQTAISRFALAMKRENPRDAVSYIDLHFNALSQFIKKDFLLYNQVHLLIQAKDIEQARRKLSILGEEEGLSDVEKKRIAASIAKMDGENTLQLLEKLYKETGSLTDLLGLIEELAFQGYWVKVADYSRILFESTNDLKDAERVIHALHQLKQSEQIIKFIRENIHILNHSQSLQIFYCWQLFNEGEFVAAVTEINKWPDIQDDQSCRDLQVNLALSSGNWNSLLSLIAQVGQDKGQKDIQELLKMAQLACYLDVPTAKDLLQTSAKKGWDDAQVLAHAYFLASTIGWEDEDTHEWLQRAIALSDNGGPIQTISMRELADQMPDWNRRESKIWEQFRLGEFPMIAVGQSIGKPLAELMLLSVHGNFQENDPRKRRVVPAYSGQPRQNPSNIPKSIGLDVTTLFTFGLLGILEAVVQFFDKIYIPHSTLRWLFEEKQKVAFHQPKRIKDARTIRDLLSDGAIHVLKPSAVPDSELVDQIGDELAGFIAEAAKIDENNEIQRLVVRSSPVHRVLSFMNEEADLTEYYQYLVSCQSVVSQLSFNGKITSKEEKRALAYLQLQENVWPQEPAIDEKATLYLDDVTVSYFLHLEILGKLKDAGFTVFISERKKREGDALISYEKDSESVKSIIENVRSVLNLSIQTGTIKVDRLFRLEGKDADLFSELPSMSLKALAKRVDAIIVDDRVFNQHGFFESPQTDALIYSALDVLNTLALEKVISYEDYLDHRMALRRAGYFFVPIEAEELFFHLIHSEIKDGNLIETLGLRAIRENILHIRMSNWLQAPKEMPWVDNLLRCFIRVLHRLWSTDEVVWKIRIRSEWIFDHLNFNAWTYLLGKDSGPEFIKTGQVSYLLLLLLPFDDMPVAQKEKFWAWIEPKVLVSLKEQYPDLYTLIVNVFREKISRLVNIDFADGGFYGPQ